MLQFRAADNQVSDSVEADHPQAIWKAFVVTKRQLKNFVCHYERWYLATNFSLLHSFTWPLWCISYKLAFYHLCTAFRSSGIPVLVVLILTKEITYLVSINFSIQRSDNISPSLPSRQYLKHLRWSSPKDIYFMRCITNPSHNPPRFRLHT